MTQLEKNPLTSLIPPENAFRHIVAFGSTGSGKTRYFLLPYFQKFMEHFGDSPKKKAGALIVDVKGDMSVFVRRALKAVNREDDLLVLGRGGNTWCNPVHLLSQDSRGFAEELIQLTELNRKVGGRNDDFWVENTRRILTVATIQAKIRGFGRVDSLFEIGHALEHLATAYTESEVNKSTTKMIRWAAANELISQREAVTLTSYLESDLQNLPLTTWGCILNYARSYLSTLIDGPLAELFSPSSQRCHLFYPEEIIDKGKVVVLSLSPLHYGPMANSLRMLIKTAFQRVILKRNDLCHFDGKSVSPLSFRPVCFVADELATTLASGKADIGDVFFLSLAREFRCACLFATQGISALHSAVRGDTATIAHLLNNCATKVFLNSTCPETIELFEKLASQAGDTDDPGYPHFHLRDRLREGDPTSCTFVPQTSPQSLKVGEAAIVTTDGKTIYGQLPCFDNANWLNEPNT